MAEKTRRNSAELLHYSDILHKYNFLMRDNLQYSHDYGTGESYSAIEAHLVLDIEESPGITITELAQRRGCSKSAITQAINRLEKKGLVQRAKSPSNQKISMLFVTPKGRTLTHCHIAFDIEQTQNLMDQLDSRFTQEQISDFFLIMEWFLTLQNSEKQDS